MKRSDLTEKLLDIKREKGWTWKYICDKIGGMSPVMITGAVLGQMKLTKPQAEKAADLFGLSKSETALLNEVPMRGAGTPMPPTDPLIYRFYELVMVNGPAWKALKKATPRGLLVGSPKLSAALQRSDLVDEYRFVVHPVVAGHGPFLFPACSDHCA